MSQRQCLQGNIRLFIPFNANEQQQRETVIDRHEEAQTGIVEMPEDEPSAITALIEFLYTCDYHLDNSSSATPLLTHAKVYTIADKYCLPLLQHLATNKFISAATAALSQSNASSNTETKLDFLSAVEYLYTVTPTSEIDIDEADAGNNSNLQYESVSLARQYSNALFNRSSVSTEVYDRARSLLHDYPEFAIDMALSSSYGLVPLSTAKGITFDSQAKNGANSNGWHSYRVDGNHAG